MTMKLPRPNPQGQPSLSMNIDDSLLGWNVGKRKVLTIYSVAVSIMLLSHLPGTNS